jgi:M6 family metalloprotease-like protein
MVELLGEMIVQFDPSIDFRDYDGVILLHAGPGQESDLKGDSPLQIWSGYLDQARFTEQLSTPDSTVIGLPTQDGTHVISDVVVLPEWEVQDLLNPDDTRLGHLGVYCHEIGAKLGMIPLFDSDPNPIPDSQGIGNFGLMGYGLWVANGFIPTLPGAFNRALVGWVQPRDVETDAVVVLRDYERGAADSVVVRVPISGREYFLVSYVVEDPDGAQLWICEGDTLGVQPVFHFDDKNNNCRFDFEDTNMDSILSPGDLIDTYVGAEWDFFMTDLIGLNTAGLGYGLLILHIDEQRLIDVLRGSGGGVQSNPRRKGVDVEEADGIEDLDRSADNARSFGSFEDYWICNQEFGPSSTPSTDALDGTPSGLRITLIDLPDSTATSAGGSAHVRIQRGNASPIPAAPQRTATRRLRGWQSTDLVGFPLGPLEALVVLADSGRVFLLDEHLDEAPVSDGDPLTLLPWQIVPPAWAGRWSAPPVVGDLDNDGIPELILAAEVDSLGQTMTRVFVWRRDGSEFRDLDANAGTNTGLFASVHGATQRLLVSDVQRDPGMEIVLATHAGDRTTLRVFEYPITAAWPCPISSTASNVVHSADLPLQLPVGHLLAGGPIAVRAQADSTIGVGWVSCDPQSLALTYWFDTLHCSSGPPPLEKDPLAFPLESAAHASGATQLLATDLDGDRVDEVLVVHTDGRVEVIGAPTSRRKRNSSAGRPPVLWSC